MIKKSFKLIYKRWILTAVFVISIISLIFFLGHDKPVVLKHGVISADSALLLIENAKVGEYEKYVTDYCYSRVLRNDSSEQYQSILKKFKSRILADNSEYGRSYLAVFETSTENKLPPDRADLVYLSSVETGKKFNDTNLILYGLSFYSVNVIKHGNLDSSRTISKYGYDLAVKTSNHRFIYFYAINLGYLMNSARYYGAAQMYFEQALKSADQIKLDKTVLLNNMLSIMVTEHNEIEAEALWKKYFEPFKCDTQSYIGQLLIMNRCLHFQNLKKYDLAENWIRLIVDSSDNRDIKYNSVRIKAAQLLATTGSNGDLLERNRDLLISAFPSSFEDFQRNIYVELEKNPKYFTIKEIEELEQMALQDQSGYEYRIYLPYIEQVKAKIYAVNGKYPEAYAMSERSQSTIQQMNSYQDTLRKSDLSEKLKINDLKNQIDISTKELSQRNFESKLYQWVSILLGAICFLVVYLILKERSINKYKEKLYLQEIASAEIQSENLRRENEMNNRIITLSKLIISKVDVVNKMLSNITQDNFQTAIKGIRGEFMNIQNAVSDAQPQLADKLLEDYSSIQNDFPNVVNLSITEKRIFVLSINGYNTKEIAGLLGLTSQYVNNARSSIRKKLEIHVNWKEVLVNMKNPNLLGNIG